MNVCSPRVGPILQGYLRHLHWAADAGLLVVVDMHQDLLGFGFGKNGAPRWACDERHYREFTFVSPWYLNSWTNRTPPSSTPPASCRRSGSPDRSNWPRPSTVSSRTG